MTEEKKSPLRSTAFFLLKVIAVVAPALITSYYGYHTAKLEIGVKTDKADEKAEAGYSTLMPAIEKLGLKLEEESKLLARLEGRFDGLEKRMNSAHGDPRPSAAITPREHLNEPLGPVLVPPEILFGGKPLPRNLNDATIQMKK